MRAPKVVDFYTAAWPDFTPALTTDTNGAIAGALFGAAYGLSGIPERWVLPVLACRPDRQLSAGQPRPMVYWPDDLAQLAEALLYAMPEFHEPFSEADLD